jgi:hypothetical protein
VNENDFLTALTLAAAGSWTTIRVTTLILRHHATQAAAGRKPVRETTP